MSEPVTDTGAVVKSMVSPLQSGIPWLATLPGLSVIFLFGLISYMRSKWLVNSFNIMLDALIIALILGMSLKKIVYKLIPSTKLGSKYGKGLVFITLYYCRIVDLIYSRNTRVHAEHEIY